MIPKMWRFSRRLCQILFLLLILQMVPVGVYGSTETSISQVLTSPGFYDGSGVILEGYVQGVWTNSVRGAVFTLVDSTGAIEVFAPHNGYPVKQGMYVRLEGAVEQKQNSHAYIRLFRKGRRVPSEKDRYIRMDIREVEPLCVHSGAIQNEEFRTFNINRCRQ